MPVFHLGNAPTSPTDAVSYHYTNEKTHDVIRSNLDRSPMYAGVIEALAHATAHRLKTKSCALRQKSAPDFPRAGAPTCNEIYPNGISTSLPFDVQMQMSAL
ncbi:FAD-dependent oxidoreductase [Escherichia coli]